MKNRKNLTIALQIIVSFLFLLSAVAKMYPSPYFAISTFEVKQLYPMGFSEGLAVYFSRTLIGIELALGLLLLQRHYLKKLVVPATIAMLVVFTIHLTITTLQDGGNSGNCGCFGSLLPMTPIEAIIKNVIAMALCIWLIKLLPPAADRRNIWVLTTVTLASILLVYMLAPIQPRTQALPGENVDELPADQEAVPTTQPLDSIPVAAGTTTQPDAPATPAETTAAKPEASEPAPQKSVYTQYFTNIDKGKKIVAMFVPGCDHCREVAKELTELKAKDKNFPPVSIIFMDEEADKIPDFFQSAGAKYPYKIIDVISFWNLLGNDKDTPGIIYLWNGNKMKEWDGINERKFIRADFVKAVNKPFGK
jgi:thiol-disulfide isomerase/thioredoxin